jgi:hypothetical protein
MWYSEMCELLMLLQNLVSCEQLTCLRIGCPGEAAALYCGVECAVVDRWFKGLASM